MMILRKWAPVLISASTLMVLLTFPSDQLQQIWNEVSHNPFAQNILFGALTVSGLLIIPFLNFECRNRTESIEILMFSIIFFISVWLSTKDIVLSLGALFVVASACFGTIFLFQKASWLTAKLLRKMSLGISLVGFMYLSMLISNQPVEATRSIGAAALMIAFWCCISIVALSVIRRPKIFAFGLAIIVASSLFNDTEHRRVAIQSSSPIPKMLKLNESFEKWLRSRPDLENYRRANAPYPVFLVSSAGGGGYAMAHSYLFLATLTSRCRNFPDHLFAMTGVSGGSVGNALYFANIDNFKRRDQDETPCIQGKPIDIDILSSDHLSPIIGTLLFVELPRKLLFLPSNRSDRSAALGASLSKNSGKWKGVEQSGLWQSFVKSSSTTDPNQVKLTGRPALIPVATNVSTGDKFLFMPFNRQNMFEPSTRSGVSLPTLFQEDNIDLDVSIVDAVVASASFPWVTPSIKFDFGGEGFENQEDIRILADGGYFENSGTHTTHEIYRELSSSFSGNHSDCDDSDVEATQNPRPTNSDSIFSATNWTKCSIPFVLMNIVLESNVEEKVDLEQSFLFDPIKTLLRTREARGSRAVVDLRIEHCQFYSCYTNENIHPVEKGFVYSVFSPNAFGLPLGWKMPKINLQKFESHINPQLKDCEGENSSHSICTKLSVFEVLFEPSLWR